MSHVDAYNCEYGYEGFEDDEWHKLEQCHNIMSQDIDDDCKLQYNPDLAQVIANAMVEVAGKKVRGRQYPNS